MMWKIRKVRSILFCVREPKWKKACERFPKKHADVLRAAISARSRKKAVEQTLFFLLGLGGDEAKAAASLPVRQPNGCQETARMGDKAKPLASLHAPQSVVALGLALFLVPLS